MTAARQTALENGLAAALETFAARERILLAWDFDGVLAPIVLDPADARPVPAARDALHRLAGRPGVEVALVSGRPLAQLRALADPPPSALLVGSHGAESDPPLHLADDPDDAAQRLLLDVTAALQRIANRHPGAVVEHKPTAAVLHTRRAERAPAAAAAMEAMEGPATWPGVQLTRGKEVVELSVVDVTKGGALRRLRERLDLLEGGVLYAGDDVTDERAFAVLDDDAGDVTVKVGDGATAARHRVPDPYGVARLLVALTALRSG